MEKIKKIKCIHIEMNPDPENIFSTFEDFKFNKLIKSKIEQLYGWSTDIPIRTPMGSFEICLHILTYAYIKRHGVQQHFISKHGSEYDDVYSYFQGLNLLVFTTFTRHQLLQDSQKIKAVFRENKISPDLKFKQRLVRNPRIQKIAPIAVPVDTPRVGIMVPTSLLKTDWVFGLQDLRLKLKTEISVTDKIEKLIPTTPFNAFIDYNLSRNYQSVLKDYIPLLTSLEAVLRKY